MKSDFDAATHRFNAKWLLMALSIMLAAALGGYALKIYADRSVEAQQETGEVLQQAKPIVDQYAAACRNPEQAELIVEAGFSCDRIEDAQNNLEQVEQEIPDPIIIQGEKGEQGDPPEFPTVLRAVMQLFPEALEVACGGSCNGENGEDAPAPTPAQLDAAVARNCGGSCNGTNGTNGTNGISVEALRNCEIQGNVSFSFDVVYSDGTVETVTCEPPPPPPPPSPEPTSTPDASDIGLLNLRRR